MSQGIGYGSREIGIFWKVFGGQWNRSVNQGIMNTENQPND